MGQVRYNGKVWRDIIRISVSSNGEVKMWDYKSYAIAGSFKLPSDARVKLTGKEVFSLDTVGKEQLHIGELNTETCVLIEGNVKEVNCENLVEVIGEIGRIDSGNVSYIDEKDLENNFKSLRDNMSSGKFNFGVGRRHVIHLSGDFTELHIYHQGKVELDFSGNVDEVTTTRSVVVKGNVREIKKAKTVKIAKQVRV